MKDLKQSKRNRLANELAELEMFPVAAFEPDGTTPASVCAFVLTLAVIYNDFKDVVLAQVLLEEVRPADPTALIPENGQQGALEAHVFRMLAGLIHELLIVVDRNRKVLEEPSLTEALRRCGKDAREAWYAIERAATAEPDEDPLVKVLLFIRNKVGFHYDPKEISAGYQAAFRKSTRHGQPCLSRGQNLQSSRFFFADAAAQAYFFSKTGGAGAGSIFGWHTRFIDHIHRAVYDLVLSFIQGRGFPFSPVSTKAARRP